MERHVIDLSISAKEYVRLSKMSHASTAMLMAARLERALERTLMASMPNLSEGKRKTIFEGRGPLSDFASKIEMSYAWGLIELEDHRKLHAIRDIRNKFAHSDTDIHFDHPDLAKSCSKLPKTGKTKTPPLIHFLDVSIECATVLSAATERAVVIRAALEKRQSLPKKSP